MHSVPWADTHGCLRPLTVGVWLLAAIGLFSSILFRWSFAQTAVIQNVIKLFWVCHVSLSKIHHLFLKIMTIPCCLARGMTERFFPHCSQATPTVLIKSKFQLHVFILLDHITYLSGVLFFVFCFFSARYAKNPEVSKFMYKNNVLLIHHDLRSKVWRGKSESLLSQ